MWVKIEEEIFENSDFKGLNYIFQILSWSPVHSVARYNVFIDLEQIKHTDNYNKLKDIEDDLHLIQQQFDDFINSKPKNAKADYQISLNKESNCFNIEEAIIFFQQPVSIILENNKNDSYFIASIIHHFDKEGVLKDHLKNGWIKFGNAGGCSNVRNYIEGELKSFEDLANRNNRDCFEYFRGMVVLDSDIEYPTQPIKSQYIALQSYLDSIGIMFHLLKKRTMENYMPDEVFEDLRSKYRGKQRYNGLLDWINVYLNLSRMEQKDYLNIKKGFSKEADNKGVRVPLNTEILKLYSIPQKDFDILDKGFNMSDFKNTYPMLYNSPLVNKQTLLNRANSTELDEILEKINELL